MKKFLKPTNDMVFQMLFGNNKNKDLTDNFIHSVLKHEKEDIKLSNVNIQSEVSLEKLNLTDKRARLDVIAEYDESLVCIEMQNQKCANIFQRIAEGRLETIIEIAKQMLTEKYPMNKIQSLTGLSKKEIHKLAESV